MFQSEGRVAGRDFYDGSQHLLFWKVDVKVGFSKGMGAGKKC